MPITQFGSNIFSNAANSVFLGISNSIQAVKDKVRSDAKATAEGAKDTTGKVGIPWMTVGLVALAVFAFWKWVLPMFRKRSSPARRNSLAKARAAKARKHRMAA